MQDSSILIEGESRTGKELIAQSIHNYSNRSKKTGT
ncbi:sigma 54-interacting transcriptional regulator [Neobacillus drentensis]